MVFSERIKALRKKANKNQEDFGRICGVSQDAVSMWERGKNIPDLATISKIAVALGVKPSDLIDGLGNATPAELIYTPCSIPVWGNIRASRGDTGIEGQIIGEIEVTEAEKKAGVFAIRVAGDSMSPRILDGDYVLFNPVNGDMRKDGTICAILVEGWDEGVIKALYRQPPDHVSLRSLNPDFRPVEIDTTIKKVEIKGTLAKLVRLFSGTKEDAGPYRVTRK